MVRGSRCFTYESSDPNAAELRLPIAAWPTDFSFSVDFSSWQIFHLGSVFKVPFFLPLLFRFRQQSCRAYGFNAAELTIQATFSRQLLLLHAIVQVSDYL